MLHLQKKYLLLTLFLFLTEIFIALYVRDWLIRPYGGDFLVVILLYCFVKSFLNIPVWKAALSVLLFAYLIEGLQYLQIVRLLGLQDSTIARIIIGTSFHWLDILCYTLGILLVVVVEYSSKKMNTKI